MYNFHHRELSSAKENPIKTYCSCTASQSIDTLVKTSNGCYEAVISIFPVITALLIRGQVTNMAMLAYLYGSQTVKV